MSATRRSTASSASRLAALIAGLVWASAASAALPGPALFAQPTAKRPIGSAAQWAGRYCTPQGCSGASQAPLSNAAGFGTAVLCAALLARRGTATKR